MTPAFDDIIPVALEGERVDRAVALLTGRPRREVGAMVADGAVRLRHVVVSSRSAKVHAGDRLEVTATATAAAEPALVADPSVTIAVVYEDADMLVVDKPAGLVVHPGAGNPHGTLVQGIVARYPDVAALGVAPGSEHRPGIVHRLDKGTSGLLMVARTAAARDGLTAQLGARTVSRGYAALVRGTVADDAGLVDAPLGRSDRDPTRISVRAGGRQARTRYQVQARYSRPVTATLIDCRLETGRTHQIRVHLAAIGHPVVGDRRYGDRGGPPGWPGLPADRPWLHAASLAFTHPATGVPLSFASPLPADLRDVLVTMVA